LEPPLPRIMGYKEQVMDKDIFVDRDMLDAFSYVVDNFSLSEIETIIDMLRDHIDNYAEQFNQMDRDLGELH